MHIQKLDTLHPPLIGNHMTMTTEMGLKEKVYPENIALNNKHDYAGLGAPGDSATDLFGFASSDLNETTRYLSRCLITHRVKVAEPLNFRGIIKGARLKCINFITIKYNQDTDFIFPKFLAHYFVIAPLNGHCEIATSVTKDLNGREAIGVLSNCADAVVSLKAQTRLLIIKFDQELLNQVEEKFARQYFSLRSKPLNKTLPLSAPSVDNFLRFADFFHREIEDKASLVHTNRIASELQSSLLIMFFQLLLDNVGCAPRRRSTPSCPPYIRRIEKYIEEHLHEPLSISDIAETTNVNARTLFHAFKRFHGVTPMAYLKMRRLKNVHKQLLAAEPNTTTVTEIATEWGFFHLGRFSADYKSIFKELPSETLKR